MGAISSRSVVRLGVAAPEQGQDGCPAAVGLMGRLSHESWSAFGETPERAVGTVRCSGRMPLGRSVAMSLNLGGDRHPVDAATVDIIHVPVLVGRTVRLWFLGGTGAGNSHRISSEPRSKRSHPTTRPSAQCGSTAKPAPSPGLTELTSIRT